MAHEILKEIGRLFTRNFDEEKLKWLNSAIESDVTIHFQNWIEYLKNENLDKAEDELNKFVQISTVMFKDYKIYKYFTLRNPIEYMLILNDENGKIKSITCNCPYPNHCKHEYATMLYLRNLYKR